MRRTVDQLLELARRHIGTGNAIPCEDFTGDPLHGSCCGHSYTRHLVDWLATELHHVINAGPRCPKCHYVMCEQFDDKKVGNLTIAQPNGTYRCYHCTPITKAEATR